MCGVSSRALVMTGMDPTPGPDAAAPPLPHEGSAGRYILYLCPDPASIPNQKIAEAMELIKCVYLAI